MEESYPCKHMFNIGERVYFQPTHVLCILFVDLYE